MNIEEAQKTIAELANENRFMKKDDNRAKFGITKSNDTYS